MTKPGQRNDSPAPADAAPDKAETHFAMNPDCFMGLYDTMKEGMAYTDARSFILHANPAFCAMLGYSEEELVGRSMLELTPEAEVEAEAGTMRSLLARSDVSAVLEKNYIHRTGRTVPVRVSLWVNRDDEGRPLGTWGVVRDLSGLREIERQIATTMEQYRFLADNSEDVIWAVNDRLEYIYVSPSVERMRGFRPEEILGTTLESHMTPESFAQIRKTVKRYKSALKRDDGDGLERMELEMHCKDGSTLWVEVATKDMRDPQGKWLGAVGSGRDVTAHKKVEERLKTNEEYLNALVSATDDYVGLYTPEGEILTVNRSMADSLDSAPEELPGHCVFDFVPPDRRAEAHDLFYNAVLSCAPVNREVVWGTRILEANVYPIVAANGSVTALASYMRDVTAIRMTEKERRKSQEQYRLIVETANEGILGMDAHQRISYANNIVADLLGYPVDEIIGRPVTDFIAPGELEENALRLARRAQGTRERYERRFVCRDGSIISTIVSASPLIGDNGDFLGVFAMITDITEVRQAHERLLAILNCMAADIYVSDLHTHEILFMNDHMHAKYGPFRPGDQCHRHLRGLDEPCPFCRKSELLDEEGNPLGTVIDERWHDGIKRWHLTHDRAIEWYKGRIVHMYLAADITELKEMEDELKKAIVEAEAANLSKNEFLANMSHEIRTPLNGLLGMLQLMELTSLEPLQREYLSTAHESGRNLLHILNEILDLSKVESGKLELEESAFELGGLLDSVTSVFRHQAEERGIDMSWTIDESLHRHFLADKGRLRQILFNLVGNAAKFTKNGSITVEAYSMPPRFGDGSALVFFQVSDTGIGIPEDKINAVFDPFTQVDGSLTRKYQGTGLGLGIVRRLVELMGGTITVVSEPGAGTTIAFTVLATPLRGAEQEKKKLDGSKKRKGLSILVAEDERVNRVVIDRILESLGHMATCVGSGEETLSALKKQPFDLILTDIQMPGMDGMDTARAIRKTLGVDTPIIALTAHAMTGDRERFIKSGMDGYIAKPFELDELQAEIDRVMAEAAARGNS
ncbi:MAG: PAS domain S-box protein [Desulfovibrionaceae bacterium]|nr:PAS domain S-box protein [Desulfovibrionaceae bacterium]